MIQNYNRQKLNLESPKQIQTSFCLVENYFLEQMNARAKERFMISKTMSMVEIAKIMSYYETNST